MVSKFIFLSTFILLFGNPSGLKKKYHKAYYETGKLKSEGWIRNDAKNGYWKFYHPSGKISEQGHYKNDLRIKYWYFYTPNGLRNKEGHYIKGEKSKWWLFFDSNGAINHKCQLTKGKKNGYCLKYKGKKLTSAEKYQNGKKIKEWYSFSSFKNENKLSDLSK